ncbi:unnamed protein product [Amaranthus hypochondriacus]
MEDEQAPIWSNEGALRSNGRAANQDKGPKPLEIPNLQPIRSNGGIRSNDILPSVECDMEPTFKIFQATVLPEFDPHSVEWASFGRRGPQIRSNLGLILRNAFFFLACHVGFF